MHMKNQSEKSKKKKKEEEEEKKNNEWDNGKMRRWEMEKDDYLGF